MIVKASVTYNDLYAGDYWIDLTPEEEVAYILWRIGQESKS